MTAKLHYGRRHSSLLALFSQRLRSQPPVPRHCCLPCTYHLPLLCLCQVHNVDLSTYGTGMYKRLSRLTVILQPTVIAEQTFFLPTVDIGALMVNCVVFRMVPRYDTHNPPLGPLQHV